MGLFSFLFGKKKKAEEAKAASAKYGIEITALWAGWTGPAAWNFTEGPETLGIVPVAYRAVRVQNLLDGAAYARKLGVKDVVTHMGFIPEDPNDPLFPGFCAAVRVVAKHLEENGQYLLFETGQETPVTLLRAIEDIGTDNLGINLDPANLLMYGKANPIDGLDVFGKYVIEVHAKDGAYPTEGRNLGKEYPLGQGKVNFPAFLEKLKEKAYEDFLLEMENEETDMIDEAALNMITHSNNSKR